MLGLAGLAAFVAVARSDVVPNSCNDLEDGTYMMKLIDSDDYPLVSIKCSNGYAILDYSHDNDIQEYFNTWSQWFINTAGPTNDYHLNWEEWFLPHTSGTPGNDEAKTNYVISPDCSSCEYDHTRQLYDENTAYWMTGTIWGCFWKIKGAHNCDYSYETTSCYTCSTNAMNGDGFVEITDDSTESEYEQTGICPHNVRSSDYYTPTEHDQCSQYEVDTLETGENAVHLKPSLGLAGQYCVCYKQPSTQYIDVSSEDIATKEEALKAAELSNDDDDEEDTGSVNDKYYLYQSDFEQGTYRLKKSGTYKIMEDITFDFGANQDSPNSEFAYLPSEDQQEEYPGANEYRNAYFLGFFAGIAIEADDVVIDLNGKTLAMSEYFYHQQRWFTTIELTSQYFLPGQGIGNFGGNPHRASNVVIKNGVLGLTSHHGIHGNDNSNIEIIDVQVTGFETHGIQLNGFNNVKMTNVEVGPTSDVLYFSVEYAHMRQLLWRYKKIADELDEDVLSGDKTEDDLKIQFYGRDEATTMREIADEIQLQMNLAWDYAINGNEVSEDSENYDSYVSARKYFINNNGYIPLGAAQYGIFLNTFGASIFTYNLATNYYSSSATLENVKIHGMKHSMTEYFMFNENNADLANNFINPFNAPLNVEEMVEGMLETNDEDTVNEILEAPTYRGNIILDAAIASNYFSNNFNYLALQILKNNFIVPWATGEDLSTVTSDTVSLICAVDGMIHTSKGINGLRLDGVEDVYIKDLEVYDLHDYTPIGSLKCGNYEMSFRQTLPMQTGFSGNMNQAININAAQAITFENIHVHDIESNTGQAFGMSVWPACNVTVKGDVRVSDIRAGSQIEYGTYEYTSKPNAAPEACGVRVYFEYSDYVTEFDDSEATYYLDTDTIVGHAGCFGTDEKGYVQYDDFEENVANADDGFGAPPEDLDGLTGLDGELPPKKVEQKQKELNVEQSSQSQEGGISYIFNFATKNPINIFASLCILVSSCIIAFMALRNKCGENKLKQLNAQWNGYERI